MKPGQMYILVKYNNKGVHDNPPPLGAVGEFYKHYLPNKPLLKFSEEFKHAAWGAGIWPCNLNQIIPINDPNADISEHEDVLLHKDITEKI